jgi:hypothetical protein
MPRQEYPNIFRWTLRVVWVLKQEPKCLVNSYEKMRIAYVGSLALDNTHSSLPACDR